MLKHCIKGVVFLLLTAILVTVSTINTDSVTRPANEEPTTTGSTSAILVTTETAVAATTEVTSSTTMSEMIVETPNTTKATVKALTTIPQTEESNLSETNSLGDFKLTAYCPCSQCNGKWANGITSTGVTAKPRHTIAVDPSVIPYGTKVIINDQLYVAEDCGGAIKGNRIDIYFSSHREASDFGVQYAEVYLVVE